MNTLSHEDYSLGAQAEQLWATDEDNTWFIVYGWAIRYDAMGSSGFVDVMMMGLSVN